jgi:protein-disulfide isomerase
MMRVALVLLLLMPGLARAAEFTDAQRNEIVTILREALVRDPSILRDAITSLQADDGKLEKDAAQAALLASRDRLVRPEDPVGGNPKGNVTIVEFFDTRCPYCRRMEPVMERFLKQDTNVRLVYKDLPILGPASTLGSKALLAAHRQKSYEKFRDVVMKLPPDTTKPMIEAEARKMGLNWDRLSADMDSADVQRQIDANLELAHTLNIQGTPALIIGDEIVPGAVGVGDLARLVAEARKTSDHPK